MLDYFVKNAIIVDGTGSEPYIGSIGIRNGIIDLVQKGEKNNPSQPSFEIIDAKGKYLTPGFIDIHRHCDLKALENDFGILELRQGITSAIGGNCGMSAAPITKKYFSVLNDYLEPLLGRNKKNKIFESYGEYVSSVENNQTKKLRINYAGLVGNGTIRIAVKGFDPSPMSKDEMSRVKKYLEEALDSGAKGLSMGLMYAPENYYLFDELLDIARVLHKYNKVLTVHIRGAGNNLLPSIREVAELAGKTGISLHISHFKAAGRMNWGGRLKIAIEAINRYREKGIDISCDVYPYNAASTLLHTLLPPSLLAGGIEEMISQLKKPSVREKLRKDLSCEHPDWDNVMYRLGWENVIISSVNEEKNNEFIGKNIKEISQITGKDEIDLMCDLLISERGKVGMVIFHMAEKDVETVLRLEYSMITSDSLYPDTGLPHPRLYGTFPRVLEKYVKEKGIISIEQAVRKMTSLPACRMKLKDRGIIKEGYKADLLVFDLEKVKETSTYTNPARLAEGFDYIFINGKIAVKHDEVGNEAHGKSIF